MTYWVTNNALEDWEELPDISAEQLHVSRKTRKILSGDLNAQIKTHPKFLGLERHFLKCQLVRISNSCTIAPKSYFKILDENENEIELDEDYAGFPEDPSSLENWVHQHPYVLKCNRCTHLEEEDEEKMSEKVTEDP